MFEAARSFATNLLLGKQADQFGSAVFERGNTRGTTKQNTRELMKAFRESPWLRAVVGKIAYSFAAVPWVLFVRVDSKSSNGSTRFIRDTTLQTACDFEIRKRLVKQQLQAGDLQQILDHPLLDLLANANPAMTGLNARRLTQTYMDLKGEVFWVLEKNKNGGVSEFWPTPPHWVVDTPSTSRPWFKLAIDGRTLQIPVDDMIWFRDLNPEDPYSRGTGTGETLGDEIEADEHAAKHIKSWFLNRAKPEMLISVQGISQAQAEEAKQTFDNKHRGFWKAHQSHWVGGDVKVQELQQSFSDMELSDLRSWERDIIVNVFGVPPEILGILSSSNRATITASRDIFSSEVLIPRLELMRAELQSALVPLFDDRLIIDYVSPRPEDRTIQLDAMKSASWAVTRGEWRRFIGLDDRGDDDNVHMVPVNLIPEIGPDEPSAPKALKAIQSKVIDASQIELIMDDIDPAVLVSDAVQNIWRIEMVAWGDATLVDLGLNLNFNLRNPRVAEHLEEFGGRLVDVNTTTRELIGETLAEGVAEGEGINLLERRVRNVFEAADKTRARMIARTEINTSSNFTNTEAFKQSGIVKQRQWIATLDDRTREAHTASSGLDGQIVALGADFEIKSGDFAGATARNPGEFGDVALNANCRCTTIAVFDDTGRDFQARRQIWKVNERRKRPWVLEAMAAFQAAFKEQKKSALAKLREVAA